MSTNPLDLPVTAMGEPRPLIDVSHLPESAEDWRAPIWWGNGLLLLIESAMFGILIAAYLYYRNVDFAQWPPPYGSEQPSVLNPNPKLLWSTIEMLLMLISIVPTVMMDRACFRLDAKAVKNGLLILVAFELTSIALRFHAFGDLYHRYDDNAYGSVTWGILFLHLLHLIISCGETILIGAWVFLHGLDARHARDVRLSAIYWYWVVGIWVPLHLLVYWGPRVL
jgi:cytochrome c oxidase subunit III